MSDARPQPDYSTPIPRRAQVCLTELELKALLGLAPDETLRSVVFDPTRSSTRIVVESPRLPQTGYRDGSGTLFPKHDLEPPLVQLPVSDHYEVAP